MMPVAARLTIGLANNSSKREFCGIVIDGEYLLRGEFGMRVSDLWMTIRGKLLQTWGADQISDMSVVLIEQTIVRMGLSASPDDLLELAVTVLSADWPEYTGDDVRYDREYWRELIRSLLAETSQQRPA